MIQVIKRDGSREPFVAEKLCLSMYRAMGSDSARFADARDLSVAIEIYLARNGREQVSSAALFEMAVKVLRRVRMDLAADAMEARFAWRENRRRRLRIRHENGSLTLWDKSWVVEMALRSWWLMPQTARILAGHVELLALCDEEELPRHAIVDWLNESVSQFGLADAVPVRQ